MEPATSPNQIRAYGIADFARVFGLSRSTIYNRLKDGTIRSVRIGGRRLIPADAAEALLQGEAV